MLLPVATTAQFPLTAAYNALGVPSLAAGGSYLDPTTQVKIYKLTSATYPAPSPNWGHDYSEGGDEISLPYNGNTRAVLVRQNGTSGGPFWLIDFTPGVGVSNPRQLSGNLSPWIDLTFTFSNNPATPYYAYVATASAIRRFDIRTMAEAPGNGWPVNESNAAWLHQSEDDGFFVWMRGATGSTIVGYEPATGTLRTYTNANLNEPRVDRAGRYVGISMSGPSGGLVVWDWLTNTVVWTTNGAIPFAHVASLRRYWLNIDWNMSWPSEFTRFVSDIPNSTTRIGGPAIGTLTHGNGNWIQHPADLNDQWAVFTHYGSLYPTGAAWLAPGGMVLITPNGQRRLLGHPYNTTGTYNYFSFAKFSSDGRYVLFTSDMSGSGRSDIFLAELPESGSGDAAPPAVTITAPILGALLSGTATVSASASDNVGVVGVQFKLDGADLGSEDTVAPYSIAWNTTLVSNGLHILTAAARDAAGNTATALAVSVTVSNLLDTTPPVISSVASSDVSSTGATIGWTTDEAGDSQVEYGPTTSYGSSTPLNTSQVTAHSQTLGGLAAGTLHHYRVKSRDAAGNLATSGDFVFTTAAGSTTPGFTGHWKFDDGSGVTAADVSGNGNAGTLFNGTAWTTGRLNGALSFDGVSAYVNVPHTAALNSYPLTVSAWVRTDAAGLHGIVNKYYPGSMNGYQVFMNGGNLCAWYFKDAANYVWDGSGCTLMTPGYNDNQWHQVVLVVDAGGGRLYVDGALKASQGWTGTPGAASATQALNIASYPGTANPYLPGVLDDIRIYNYALSATEITTLYNAAAAPTVESVVWTSLANVTATGNSVQKTAGCDGCQDAGATSQQQITSGDGYLEFTASETAALRFAGLSNGNQGTSASEIKYAVRLQSGIAEVNESGAYQADTSFVAGDVFRVAVESGVVTYYKNGTPIHTSTTAPSYPLLVDAAILNLNGTVANAMISRVP